MLVTRRAGPPSSHGLRLELLQADGSRETHVRFDWAVSVARLRSRGFWAEGEEVVTMEAFPQRDSPRQRTETAPDATGEHSQATTPESRDARWVIQRIQESFDCRSP